MVYTFVLKFKGTKNESWWLKISDMEQLKDYLIQSSEIFSKAMENFQIDKAYNKDSKKHGPHYKLSELTYIISENAKKNNMSYLESSIRIENQRMMTMIDMLDRYGYLYINKNGGFFHDKEKEYISIQKDSIEFPKPRDLDKNEIKILQFPDGKHYYPYIRNKWIKVNGKGKWNTYEGARQAALDYLNSKN